MVVKNHPTLYKLINHFRIEQKNTELLHAQIKSGDFYKRKNSEVDKRRKLFNLCKSFDKNNLTNYMDEVILII